MSLELCLLVLAASALFMCFSGVNSMECCRQNPYCKASRRLVAAQMVV